jgi:hypothetical protein
LIIRLVVQVAGLNTGPFGLMRMPGRNRSHGNAAGSAGMAPGSAQKAANGDTCHREASASEFRNVRPVVAASASEEAIPFCMPCNHRRHCEEQSDEAIIRGRVRGRVTVMGRC